MTLYKQNKYAAAEKPIRKVIELRKADGNLLGIFGNVLMYQGKFAEAIEHTRQAITLLEREGASISMGQQQLEVCKKYQVLVQKLPSVINGKRKAGADELVELAKLCGSYLNRFSDSATLYDSAFKLRPSLANSTFQLRRTDAACAAAMAAAGKDVTVALKNKKTAQQWRNLALSWLQLDLAALQRVQRLMPAILVGKQLREDVGRYLQDVNLEVVRNPKYLQKLPDPERKEWHSFWSNVRSLASKVGLKPKDIGVVGKLPATKKKPVLQAQIAIFI